MPRSVKKRTPATDQGAVTGKAKQLPDPPTPRWQSRGPSATDLPAAVRQEFKETEDLPNTTNPDDWAKIAGKKGEPIVFVKTLLTDTKKPERNVEKIVNTGQYL